MGSKPLRARHGIGGEWVDAAQSSDSVNPATGEKIGTYTEATAREARQAIAAALKAFRETSWRDDRRLRAKVLNKMADRFDKALLKVEKALTVFAGQFCITGSRLLVHRPILDVVRERLAARLGAVKVGPASDPSSDMGPMINLANVRRVDAIVEEAIAAGTKVVVRGGPCKEGPLAKGSFCRPTLLEIQDHCTAIAQSEVFGPVLVMQAFDTDEEAITLANHSEYGFAASIWSNDVDRPRRAARRIEAGTVWINNWAVVYDETEEGGYKQSGIGRLNGVSALDDFLEYRTIIQEVEL
jgi:betaine-aldehyde dehydrogenase